MKKFFVILFVLLFSMSASAGFWWGNSGKEDMTPAEKAKWEASVKKDKADAAIKAQPGHVCENGVPIESIIATGVGGLATYGAAGTFIGAATMPAAGTAIGTAIISTSLVASGAVLLVAVPAAVIGAGYLIYCM